MSRIGKLPIAVPKEVKVTLKPEAVVIVGPKGTLTQNLPNSILVKQEDGHLLVSRKSDMKTDRALHGLMRTLISNMVHGVTHGYQKDLMITGMGYRAAQQGNNVTINLGYSHPVVIEPPSGIALKVEGQNKITVHGISKQLVGKVAADIRSKRSPDAYKGKGIRYAGEILKLKPGKSGGKGASAAK